MWCVVSNCYNDSSQTNCGVSYHLFPKEPPLRAAWLEALNMSHWEPDECSAVCSIHFLREDLLVRSQGRRAVRPGAVPAIGARVCRICFSIDSKLYSLETHKILSKEYETLTGLLIESDHNLPPYLCSNCARRLLDYARFRTTSLRAHSLLLNVLKKLGNVPITLELIRSVKGVEKLRSLIKTDYDLDIELSGNGNIYIDARAGAMHTGVHVDVDINAIKVENDDVSNDYSLNAEHNTNNVITDVSGMHEEIAEVGIKIENDDAINSFYTDVTSDDNVAYVSRTQQNVARVIKTENSDVINQNRINITDTTNEDITCISKIPENFAKNGVKSENNEKINVLYPDVATNDNMMCISSTHQDATAEIKADIYDIIKPDIINIKDTTSDSIAYITSINKDIGNHRIITENDNFLDQYVLNVEGFANTENKKEFVGEDFSSEDSLSIAEAKQKVKMKFTGVVDDEVVPREVDTQQSQEAGSVLTVNKLYCGMCPYKTNSELLLLSHLKAHSAAVMYKCHICSYRTIHNSSLKLHFKSHSEEKPFSCDICSKTFKQKLHFTTHLKAHCSEKPFSCDMCNKSYSLKCNLKMHIKTHFGEKPFSCKICNKTFYQKFSLITHLRTHSGEKPFSCHFCNKTFSQKGHVTNHIRTYHGIKPFLCEICNKSFSRKSILKGHMRIHSDEKPFLCAICNKAFNLKMYLTKHLRTHSGIKPYPCDVCNKSFTLKHNLTTHLRIHSGEKPYPCDICNRAFRQRSGLKTHMETHSCEKPYSCEFCSKPFSQKRHLIRHLQIHPLST